MSKNVFQCNVCGCMRYSDIEGSGDNFTDYWCEDCESLVRIYDDEE